MFKYINNEKMCLFKSEEPKKCSCCGKPTNIYSDITYPPKKINALCVDCIKSGKASKKFKCVFNHCKPIDNKGALEEVEKRTPHVLSSMEFEWPGCCNDMCVYMGPLTVQDVSSPDFWENVGYEDEYVSLEEIKRFHPSYFLLFKCQHCGKPHVIFDFD